MAWFRCLGNGGSPSLKPYKDYLGQLIPRVSASTTKITESGHDTSSYAWYAFDGIESSSLSSPDHCWLATNGDTDAYIQYEFDRVFWFNKLAIKCFSNYSDDWVGNIKVLGSTDGVNWENILANGTNIEITAKYQELTYIEINLNDSSEYQYIRIQADNNAFTVYYSPSCFFDEIYVYGGISGSYLNYKEGEFISANLEYGIVDVEVGFKPDLLMVSLPFDRGDTVSYWEKNLSYAQNYAIWNLFPAEPQTYVVELGRTTGETGIQAINDNGFSFMSKGANTQNKTCKYRAVKYTELPLEMNILKGTSTPSSSQGSNGQIYLKYANYTYSSFMNDTIIVRENEDDTTDKKLFFVGLTKTTTDVAVTDADLISYLTRITSGTGSLWMTYDYLITDLSSAVGHIGFYKNSNDIVIRSWTLNKGYTTEGTFYGVLDLNDTTTESQTNSYSEPYATTSPITATYAKVNNTWQNLIGTDVNDISETTKILTPIDMSTFTQYREGSMWYVAIFNMLASTWNGGGTIGATCYITNPIDVTNINKLYYELETKNCYGGGSTAQQERWNIMIGLMQTAPSNIISVTYDSAGFAAGDDFANSNTNYGTQEIDVSNLTGNYYFVMVSHGWNATISNLRYE